MPIRNPILPGTHPDPSLCRVGNDYYLVTSSFEYFPGVPVYHSIDLVNWRQIGHVIDRPSQLNYNRQPEADRDLVTQANIPACIGIYAPTIRFHDGLFYMITTQVGGIGNFYVTAKNPAGPWSDPHVVDTKMFDPSFLFDDDGTVYYTRRGEHGIVQAEFDLAAGKIIGEPRIIVEKFICTDIEGPHLYKIHGQYYLMAAEGGSRFGHCEVIGRSSSPWGPFETCPHNPILTHRDLGHTPIRDTGHAELIEDAQCNWWLFCLATRHRHYNSASILGRETFLAPVTWTPDGWPLVNGGRTIPDEFSTPLLPEPFPRPAAWRDDFSQSRLDFEWNFVRSPQPGSWSLAQRLGHLRLRGSALSLDEPGSPVFIGRRQEDLFISVACRMEFDPSYAGEEAGLTVYTNNHHHYDLLVTRRDMDRVALLRRRVGDLLVESRPLLLEDGALILRAACDGDQYTFSVAVEEGEEQVIGTGLARFLSPESADNNCVWTGVYLGIFASGSGVACLAPADFDWFEVHRTA